MVMQNKCSMTQPACIITRAQAITRSPQTVLHNGIDSYHPCQGWGGLEPIPGSRRHRTMVFQSITKHPYTQTHYGQSRGTDKSKCRTLENRRKPVSRENTTTWREHAHSNSTHTEKRWDQNLQTRRQGPPGHPTAD